MKTEFIYLLFFIFLLPLTAKSQPCVIRGTITSEKNGIVLEHVNVVESYSGIGTITNSKGEFRLMLNPGFSELNVTLDGYQSVVLKMKFQADTTINFQLEPQLNNKLWQKAGLHTDLLHKTNKK